MDRGVIVADTDAFIDLLRGEGAHRKIATLMSSGRLATTAISVFEILERARVRLRSRGGPAVPSGAFASTR